MYENPRFVEDMVRLISENLDNFETPLEKLDKSIDILTEQKKNEILKESDPFVPNPPPPYDDGRYWNFTTGDILGWRVTSNFFSQDVIYNISNLKYFEAKENITGNDAAYYGVQLTRAFYNISTMQVEEFTNRTVFPLLNASLINYTLGKYNGLSIFNMQPIPFMKNDIGLESFINLFVPKNTSNDLLDIYWVADALHWFYSFLLSGLTQFIDDPADLCDMTVTANSIEYSNPSTDSYCYMYYYDNGTLQNGQLKITVEFGPGPPTTLSINWTRLFDFNPLDDLKWSEDFDEVGEILYIGMDTNETMLIFNHTVDMMEFEIEWDDDDEEWDFELLYYQQIWANVSYWDYENEEWEYLNCTAVPSANEIYPIVFGGDDDDDDDNDDDAYLPPFILTPNQSTLLGVGDIFKMFELSPEFDDIKVESGENWVKLTNTTTSNIAILSYQTDGIVQYFYIQDIGIFSARDDDDYDEDIVIYYKNSTFLPGPFHTFSLTSFDLISVSAVINISLDQASLFYHSGFPYNPTNNSINNAIGFFDILIHWKAALDSTTFTPINITFYYDHGIYYAVKIFWFNMSANNERGDWEEIPIISSGTGFVVVSLNHTCIIAIIASRKTIYVLPGDDDDDDDDKPVAIPYGSYYLLFSAIASIGLIVYTRRKIINNKI